MKKYWCALHKDDKSRKCFSDSCRELRKMKDIAQRVSLIKENKDCTHCLGDHKPEDCSKKDRVCGGGKSDRGCSQNHKLHELLCPAAKVCSMMVLHAKSVGDDNHREEGVVLCIMRVRAPKGKEATVFWDGGSSVNFIREAFAKLCGFKWKWKTLSVTTLGGKVTDYLRVKQYTCSLLDESGEVFTFKAYGLESITGRVSPVSSAMLRKLFPNVSKKVIELLQRGSVVDFLIGLLHPSWHPQPAEQAVGGGDFWLWRCRLGICVGGRHPMIEELTRKSDEVFTVNHTYYTDASLVPLSSHELEYCPARSISYYAASVVQKEGLDPISSGEEKEPIQITPLHAADPNPFHVAEPIPFHTADTNPFRVAEPIPSHAAEPIPFRVADPNPIRVADPIPPRVADSVPTHVTGLNRQSAVGVTDASYHIAECWLEDEVTPKDSALNVHAPCFSPSEGSNTTSEEPSKKSVVCAAALTVPFTREHFFQAEALGTVVEPQCGGCKCSRCPVPGSQYSFKEQKEFDIIMKNLQYNKEKKRWFTVLPWKCPRSVLPRNYKAALKNYQTLKRSLQKKPAEVDQKYSEEVHGMVERGAAILLSEEALQAWEGDFHYLPLVGVKGKKGSMRLCFDAARKQCGSPSMNDCLCKGPDRFLNNLLSVILGFRNGRVGCVADIRKFHNQVHLFPEDIHMQRFLWSDGDPSLPPKTYAVAVNNFGVKPANCIATCALRNSADHFASIYPTESEEVKKQTYIDDGLTAAPSKQEALVKSQRWDEICAHASMHNKGWTFSGDDKSDVVIGSDEEVDMEKILGLLWVPNTDSFIFKAKLHVKIKLKQGGYEIHEISTVAELLQFKEFLLNRRELLSNVHSIFDPPGLLAPVLLQPKLLMRESWTGPNPVGWDDLLPESQCERWIEFLTDFLSLGELSFPRSLWPEGEVVGLPVLIVFSDGSLLAFGAVAYIRWELKAGGFWTRLIMSKCKIAPKNILSVPRMELNGAVLGNRIKNFILKDTNLKFSKTIQLVDSSTVLGYVHKECGVFKPYEGIRVSEIQSSNTYADEKLVGWAWVAGTDNPADWCTKPRPVKDLIVDGFWQSGPKFLLLDESEWPIKLSYRTDRLEGEMVVGKQCHVAVVNVAHPDLLGRIAHRFSSFRKMCRILGWILRLGVPSGPLTAAEVRRGKQLLLKYSQLEMIP